jgi:hypothetical protein
MVRASRGAKAEDECRSGSQDTCVRNRVPTLETSPMHLAPRVTCCGRSALRNPTLRDPAVYRSTVYRSTVYRSTVYRSTVRPQALDESCSSAAAPGGDPWA